MGDAPDRASPRYVVEADGTPSPPPARTRGVPPPGYCGLRLSLRRLPLSANVRSRCTGRTRIRSCRVCSEGKSRLIFFRLIRLFRRVPRDPPGGGDCVGVGPRQRTPRHRRPCCFCRQHSRFSKQRSRPILSRPYHRVFAPEWSLSRCPGTYPRFSPSLKVARTRTKRKKALTPRTTSPPVFRPWPRSPFWPCRWSVASPAPGLSPRNPCGP